MEKDPGEFHNLFGQPEYEEIRQQLTQKMLEWLIHTSDVVPVEGRG